MVWTNKNSAKYLAHFDGSGDVDEMAKAIGFENLFLGFAIVVAIGFWGYLIYAIAAIIFKLFSNITNIHARSFADIFIIGAFISILKSSPSGNIKYQN